MCLRFKRIHCSANWVMGTQQHCVGESRERERESALVKTVVSQDLNNHLRWNQNNDVSLHFNVSRRFYLLLLLIRLIHSLTHFVAHLQPHPWISIMSLTITSYLCMWLIATYMPISCNTNRTRIPHAMFRSTKISSIAISLQSPLVRVLRISVWEKELSWRWIVAATIGGGVCGTLLVDWRCTMIAVKTSLWLCLISFMASTTTSCLCTWFVTACMCVMLTAPEPLT